MCWLRRETKRREMMNSRILRSTGTTRRTRMMCMMRFVSKFLLSLGDSACVFGLHNCVGCV